MNVKILYFGQLRQVAGRASDSVTAGAGATAQGVLAELAEQHGDDFRSILFAENGALRASLMVLINDTPAAKDKPILLQDGDEVKLLPAIAGG